MKRLSTLFLSFYIAFLCPHIYAEPLSADFITIASNEIIPDNVVLKLIQDKQGFIWLGTPAGALRYDGYQFLRFNSVRDDPTTIGGNFVRDILQLKNGDLAFMSDPGGLSILKVETEKIIRLNTLDVSKKFKNKKIFRALAQTSNGVIWAGGIDGLLKISEDLTQIQLYRVTKDNLAIGNIQSLLAVGEQLYLGSDLGLFKFDHIQQVVEKIPLPQSEERSSWISSLLHTSNGTIWAGGSPNIFYLPQTERDFKLLTNSEYQTGVHSPVHALHQINDSTIWIAQLGKIQVIDTNKYEFKSLLTPNQHKKYGLEINDVRTVLKDNADQIWLGGYGGGLQRYAGKDWVFTLRAETKNPLYQLSHPSISAVFELKNGNLLLGSKGEGIDVYQHGVGIINRIKPDIKKPNMLKSGYIRAIAEQAGGRIWVGESPSYLFYSDDNLVTFIHVGRAQGYTGAKIRSMLVDSLNRLWIATEEGVSLWNDKTQQFNRLKMRQTGELLTDTVNVLFEDHQQRIWLGTNSSGLLIADSLKGDVYEPGLAEQSMQLPRTIIGMLIDAKGTLWFDTPQGLHFVRDLSSELFHIQRIVVKNAVSYKDFGANLLQDKQGRIWSHKYIYDPDKNSLYGLTANDGIQLGTGWFRSYTQTKSGQLFFGGSTGVVGIWPDQFKLWDHQPKIVATDIRIDNLHQPVLFSVNNQLVLQPENKSFSIDFAALDLSKPSKNKYRYKLIGYDDGWLFSNANQRSVTYTNLWPGEYEFIVQGSNRLEIFSPYSTHIKVIVQPKFWQTLWFLFGFIFLTCCLLYLLLQFRIRRLKRNAKLLEEIVSVKTAELKASQAKLLEKEKMSALGVMAMGIAHEINTPIGIGVTSVSCLTEEVTDLKNKLDTKQLTGQQLNSFIEFATKSIHLLQTNLDKTAALVELFKQLSIQDEMYPIVKIDFKQWLPFQLSVYEKQLSNVNLVLDIPDNSEMSIKALALGNILSELLLNIFVHAIADNNKVTISITLTLFEDKAKLSVSDNGKGIDVQDYDRIFDPFVTSKRGTDCKGLGLYRCYNLATNILHGDIQFNTQVTSKTQVEVTFPFSR